MPTQGSVTRDCRIDSNGTVELNCKNKNHSTKHENIYHSCGSHIFTFLLLPDPKALLRYENETDIVIMLRLIIQIARSKNEWKGSCSFKEEM